MNFILLLYSAFFPIAIFLFLIYRKDDDKEPPELLLKCFLWGCVITLPVIFAAEWLSDNYIVTSNFWSSFFYAFVISGFLQEVTKFLCLYLIIWKHKEFDQYIDGIIYAVFISLGFALMENLGHILLPYLFDLDFYQAVGIAFTRFFIDVPAHLFFGVIMGYFFACAKFSEQSQSKKMLCFSLCIPLLLNGIYNFSALYFTPINEGAFKTLTFPFILVFIMLFIIVWILISKTKQKDKEKRIHDMLNRNY